MELTVEIPFQKLLTAVKSLTPEQKIKLKQELNKEDSIAVDKSSFVDMLINGPVYTKDEIEVIKANRKSIAQWRTKN